MFLGLFVFARFFSLSILLQTNVSPKTAAQYTAGFGPCDERRLVVQKSPVLTAQITQPMVSPLGSVFDIERFCCYRRVRMIQFSSSLSKSTLHT